MTTAPTVTESTGRTPVFSSGYKGVVLSLLLLTYAFNFIDRTIVSTIGQAIKVDLKITDTQLGLLGGLSFAILYTVLGIPIARLAERWNRVSVIALAMVVWSGFTVACGFAGSFVQLLAMRVGVGVGEAGCSPPSHSLISDYYEPKRRATALSVYAFGIPLGGMIGAVAGGWLAKNFGWRVAFMAVGAPGVVMAVILKLIVKEPPRGHSDPPHEARVGVAPFSVGAELRELGAVARSLFGTPVQATREEMLRGLNPLHHLPGIGMIYRAVTGETIPVTMRVAGAMLVGGPLGALGAGFMGLVEALIAMGPDLSRPQVPAGMQVCGSEAGVQPVTPGSLTDGNYTTLATTQPEWLGIAPTMLATDQPGRGQATYQQASAEWRRSELLEKGLA